MTITFLIRLFIFYPCKIEAGTAQPLVEACGQVPTERREPKKGQPQEYVEDKDPLRVRGSLC